MASANRRGTDRITYTPPGTETPVTFLLAVPALIVPVLAVGSSRVSFRATSADLSAREVVNLASAARDITLLIRMDDQPAALQAMLEAGWFGNVTLTYRRSAEGTAYPCRLEGGEGLSSDGVRIRPDRDRGRMKEWEAGPLHLRRVDGGTFAGLFSEGTAG
jgi:hypothetical protein